MPDDLITAVERSKKGAVVTLNGEEKIFVSRALLIEREFAEGQSLQRDELAQWLLPRQYPEALNLAVSLLAQRARSSGEIREKAAGQILSARNRRNGALQAGKRTFPQRRGLRHGICGRPESPPDGPDAHRAGASPQGHRPRADPARAGIAGREEADDAALVLARKLLKSLRAGTRSPQGHAEAADGHGTAGLRLRGSSCRRRAGPSGAGGVIFFAFPGKGAFKKPGPRLTTFCQLSIIDTIGNPRLFVHEQTGQTAFKIHKHNTGGNTNGNQNDR